MKWEYQVHTIEFFDLIGISEALNSWGSEGWELVTVAINATHDGRTVLMLKRPIPNSK
jgi:hypothetical protein